MTLIIGVVTEKYAIQVSDRRTTRRDANGKISFCNHRANKSIIFNNQMLFGYTGKAYIDQAEKERTDLWITKIIRDSSFNSISELTQIIAFKATDAFKQLPDEYKLGLTIFGVGWVRLVSDSLQPVIYRISNSKGPHNTNIPTQAKFTVYPELQPILEPYIAGQTIPGYRRRRLKDQIQKNSNDPQKIIACLVKVIRDIALGNRAVGKSLMVCCLPKSSINKPTLRLPDGQIAYLSISSLEHSNDVMTFFYLPAGKNKKIMYGPHVVSKNTSLTGFKVTSLEKY